MAAEVEVGGVFFLARRILLGVEEELTILVGQLLGVGEAWGLVDFKVDWKKAGVEVGGVFFLARRMLLWVEEELAVLVGRLLGVGEEC